MNDTIRTFIAIPVPGELCELIQKVQKDFQRHSKIWASYPPSANTHLTMRFLGDVRRDRMEGIIESLTDSLEGLPGFSLTTTGLGAFPSLRRPHVIWLGINEEPALMVLHTAVEEGLNRAGYGYGDKQFHPHLTIARVKSIEPSFRIDQLVGRMRVDTVQWEVEELVLMSSILRPTGAVYKPLARFPLEPAEAEPDELDDEEELAEGEE